MTDTPHPEPTTPPVPPGDCLPVPVEAGEVEDSRELPALSAWQNPLVKKGRLGSPLVEVTPFVLRNRLYRLENWQKFWDIPGSQPGEYFHEDEVRIRDMESDEIVAVPLRGHAFGAAFVWRDRVYVFAGDYGEDKPWRQITEIVMTSSVDLQTWTEPQVVLRALPGEHFFNVAVCRDESCFVLLYETDDPEWPPFTFRYCTSPDLADWTLIPEAIYGCDKYVGGPALYYEGGFYYTLYLHDLGGKWETRITRSRDLIDWEDAPQDRPFLTFDESVTEIPLRPYGTREVNASDAELCEWHGKTLVYFTGSDQQVGGDLQCAEFHGTPRRLLESFYDEP